MKAKLPTWETVGHVSVDAGLIQIGDPCYTSDDRNHAQDWEKFCSFLEENEKDGVTKVPHGPDNEGKAVVVQSGFGDGLYPVQVRRKDGCIKEVRVKFF